MTRRLVASAILIGALLAAPAAAIDMKAWQQMQFNVQHSGDAEAQRAWQTLVDKKVVTPQFAIQEADRGPSRGADQPADARLIVGEGLLRSVMVREFVNKKLPKEVLEFNLRFTDAAIQIDGRLDGPLFVNPRFEATIDFAFLQANQYRIRVHSLKVAGFEFGLFTKIFKGYLDDALRRVFINGCKIVSSDGLDKSVNVDVTINPNGLVPGIGDNAVLSGFAMRNREMVFSLTLKKR